MKLKCTEQFRLVHYGIRLCIMHTLLQTGFSFRLPHLHLSPFHCFFLCSPLPLSLCTPSSVFFLTSIINTSISTGATASYVKITLTDALIVSQQKRQNTCSSRGAPEPEIYLFQYFWSQQYIRGSSTKLICFGTVSGTYKCITQRHNCLHCSVFLEGIPLEKPKQFHINRSASYIWVTQSPFNKSALLDLAAQDLRD